MSFKVQKDAFDYLDAPILRVTTPDTPLSFSKVFVDAFVPNEAKIIEAVRQVTYQT